MRNLSEASQFKCTVVSLVPYEIRESKPGMTPAEFILPASDGKIPTVLAVSEGTYGIYIDGDRGRLKARTPSTEVSRSIIEDYIGSQLAVSHDCRPALFVVPGALKAEQIIEQYKEDIEEALGFQRNWFVKLVKMADDSWNKYHQHGAITELMRYAATSLGETKEWMIISVARPEVINCPACFVALNSPKQIICHSCGCVINEEAYARMKFTGNKLKEGFAARIPAQQANA